MVSGLCLRPLLDADIIAYRAWFDDPELARRVAYTDDAWKSHVAGPDSSVWVYQDAEGDMLAVIQVDEEDEIGFVELAVAPSRRRQGFGTAALSAFVDGPGRSYAVLEGQVAPDNAASLACCRRCGFTILPMPDNDGFLRAVRAN